MNYAIIAAGEGSRLVEEGLTIPKPLVKINDEYLLDRLIRIFCNNHAESITIIINESMIRVKQHVESIHLNIPLNIIIRSTPSSMHSFYELSKYIPNGKFCLTTVDTIFNEKEFSCFISEFDNSNQIDGLMGVTDYIDDEKPLYIETNSQMEITGFYDDNHPGCRYISGGIYGLTEKSIPVLEQCISDGKLRMRNYQRSLIENKLQIKAFPFSKIIDVDHIEDIRKAESFICAMSV